jgi:hypothetical protein
MSVADGIPPKIKMLIYPNGFMRVYADDQLTITVNELPEGEAVLHKRKSGKRKLGLMNVVVVNLKDRA